MWGRRLIAGMIAFTASTAIYVQAEAGVVRLDSKPWPGGLVPYEEAASLSAQDRAMVEAAVAKWNAALKVAGSHVMFVQRTRPDQARLLILRVAPPGPNQCRATLAYERDRGVPRLQTGESLPAATPHADGYVLLSGTCTQRSVVHELGHALGLLHEQSRSDRDPWLSIALMAPYREPRCDRPVSADWERLWCSGYAKTLSVGGAETPVGRDPAVLRSRDLLFTSQYDVCSVMQYLEDPIHARRHVALKFTRKSHDWERRHDCRAGGAGGGVISALDAATVKAFYVR